MLASVITGCAGAAQGDQACPTEHGAKGNSYGAHPCDWQIAMQLPQGAGHTAERSWYAGHFEPWDARW